MYHKNNTKDQCKNYYLLLTHIVLFKIRVGWRWAKVCEIYLAEKIWASELKLGSEF